MSSQSSRSPQRQRSRSSSPSAKRKLFITNLNGDVPLSSCRPTLPNSNLSFVASSNSTALSLPWSLNATEIPSIASLSPK